MEKESVLIEWVLRKFMIENQAYYQQTLESN
jgi:hypothetical protein